MRHSTHSQKYIVFWTIFYLLHSFTVLDYENTNVLTLVDFVQKWHGFKSLDWKMMEVHHQKNLKVCADLFIHKFELGFCDLFKKCFRWKCSLFFNFHFVRLDHYQLQSNCSTFLKSCSSQSRSKNWHFRTWPILWMKCLFSKFSLTLCFLPLKRTVVQNYLIS